VARSREISFRTLMIAGVYGSLFAMVIAAFAMQWGLTVTGERAALDRQRLVRLARGSEDVLQHMLNEEVGLHGYLASGEIIFLQPYAASRDFDDVDVRQMLDLLTPGERPELAMLITQLHEKCDSWQALAVTQIAQRRRGPIPHIDLLLDEGRSRFDDIRAAKAELDKALEMHAASRNAANDRRLEVRREISFAVLLGTLLGAALLIGFVTTKTLRPLSELVTAALDDRSFPAPSGRLRIRELSRLSSALQGLQGRVREREAQLARQHDIAAALSAFSEVSQQIEEEDELHSMLARALHKELGPSELRILLRNPSEDRLDIVWPRDEGSALVAARFPILQEPATCRGIRTGVAVSIADASAPTACECKLGVPEEGSYLCLPMIATGEVIGLVNLQARRRGDFTDERVRLAQAYVGVAATALSSIRLLALARERALRDGLTGVYNRRFLDELFPKQLALAHRTSRPLSVLMLDLDHFKACNDTYGHDVGDRVLCAFVGILQDEARTSDSVIRYGGEEFLMLLPETDGEGAAAVGERIRRALERRVFGELGVPNSLALRCSIGVSSMPSHGDSPNELILAADRALYLAKQQGRNRVVVAETKANAA
jgi:diguanylate cyclase (GGDEF)-like protein